MRFSIGTYPRKFTLDLARSGFMLWLNWNDRRFYRAVAWWAYRHEDETASIRDRFFIRG